MAVVGRIVEEFAHGVASVRSDPTCRMFTTPLNSGGANYEPCGKPATTRVNLWPHWSEFWCPEHAANFDGPIDFPHGGIWDVGTIDEPTFRRRMA